MQGFLLYLFAFFLGASVGSFLNVCIYRLPRRISVVSPPSFCPNCKRRLPWYDLVPLLSYVALRGRCRYCGWKISVVYPLVELAVGVWFVFSLWRYGISLRAVQSVAFFCFLLVVAVIDLKDMIVLDSVVLSGTVVGAVLYSLLSGLSVPSAYWYFLGLGVAWGSIYLIRVLSRGGMGDGDPYIALMIAAFLDLRLVGVMLFFAFVVGGVVGALLMLMGRKGRKDALPFGPFLAAGGLLAYLCGDFIIRWYVNLFSL